MFTQSKIENRKSKILLAVGCLFALVSARAGAQYPTTIQFSGYTWMVKKSAGKVGPGPNYFSDSTANVFVDTAGRLHLRMTKSRNKWYCAEVICTQSLGYGTYRFYLDSAVDALDPKGGPRPLHLER